MNETNDQQLTIKIEKTTTNQVAATNNIPKAPINLPPRDIELRTEKVHSPTNKSFLKHNNGNKISSKLLSQSYKKTMAQVQDELPPLSKLFSKFIHSRIIELISGAIGNTIARPRSILIGSIFAFIITIFSYTIAKRIGYVLSGFETIIAFTFGWFVGIIYDYLHLLFFGKK